jgi:hypothetical protein
MGVGKFGASSSAGQFRYIALNIEGQRVAYALDREGEFPQGVEVFNALVRSDGK